METFDAGDLIPPHVVTKPEQVRSLACSMARFGWIGPPLIGYRWYGGFIQLLSGAHRRTAAGKVGLRVPVIIRDVRDVYAAWGNLEKWKEIMNATKEI